MINKVIKKEEKELVIELIDDTVLRKFDDKIYQIEVASDKIIVLFDSYKNTQGNRNIFCLNERGEILWQVQDPDEYRAQKKNILMKTDSPFTGVLGVNDKEKTLRVYNWKGYICTVDLETGKILSAEWTK